MAGDRDRVILAEVIAKCWQDAKFQGNFMHEPKKMLQESGMEIAANVEVEVFRSDNRVTFVGLANKLNHNQYFEALKSALSSILPIEPHHEVRLVQSSDTYLPIIIPVPPRSYLDGKLTDADLAAVAAGGYAVEAINVATTANAVGEANAAAVSNVAAATEAAVAGVAVAVAVIACVLI